MKFVFDANTFFVYYRHLNREKLLLKATFLSLPKLKPVPFAIATIGCALTRSGRTCAISLSAEYAEAHPGVVYTPAGQGKSMWASVGNVAVALPCATRETSSTPFPVGCWLVTAALISFLCLTLHSSSLRQRRLGDGLLLSLSPLLPSALSLTCLCIVRRERNEWQRCRGFGEGRGPGSRRGSQHALHPRGRYLPPEKWGPLRSRQGFQRGRRGHQEQILKNPLYTDFM